MWLPTPACTLKLSNSIVKYFFAGKAKSQILDVPEGCFAQWAEKGSYREVQMLETIKKLPKRTSPFTKQTGQNYGIYVLDDFGLFHF